MGDDLLEKARRQAEKADASIRPDAERTIQRGAACNPSRRRGAVCSWISAATPTLESSRLEPSCLQKLARLLLAGALEAQGLDRPSGFKTGFS